MEHGTLADHLYKINTSGNIFHLSWEQRLNICIDAAHGLDYLHTEYFLTGRLTKKSDVYAFGAVLLEVLCGKAAVDIKLEEEQWSLVLWAQHCIREKKLDQIIDLSLRDQNLCTLPECVCRSC
ncbi:hypothetical protein ACSBR1_010472 [Camellia fascicularis]